MNWLQNVPVVGTSIGAKLKMARQKAGLSQRVLADKLGLHRSAIAKYEAEELKISAETLLRMAEVFEMSVSEILGEEAEDSGRVDFDPISAIRVYLDELEKSTRGFAWTDEMVLELIEEARRSGQALTKEDLEAFKSLQRGDRWRPVPGSSMAARDDKRKGGNSKDEGSGSG